MRRLIFLPLLSIVISSCERVIPLDAEYREPKLVVNAMAEPDSLLRVYLSHSLSVLDNGELGDVEGAIVELRDVNGNLLETLVDSGQGVYKGSVTILPFTEYRISASQGSYTPVSASDITTGRVPIIITDTATTSYLGEEVFELTFEFVDPPGKGNFYFVEVFLYDEDTTWNQYWENQVYFQSNNQEFDNLEPDAYTYRGFISDEFYDGNTIAITCAFDPYFTNNQYEGLGVRLTSCSESAYRYFQTLRAFQQTSGDPFSQPVLVYSNIQDGFGIFGSIARDTSRLILGQ